MANKQITDFTLKALPESTDEVLIQDVGGTTKKINIGGMSAAITPTSTVLINAKSDFPAPVTGVITLASDTMYLIGADIAMGTDVFVGADGTAVSGVDSVVTTISSTSTGDLFTMVDSTMTISSLTINIPSGRIFNYTDTGSRIFRAKELIVICDKWGVFTSTSDSIIRFNNVAGTITTDGLQFVGDFRNLFWDTSAININGGALFNLGTATFDSVLIDVIIAVLGGSANIVSGLTGSGNINVAGIGDIQRVITHGVGTPLSGVNADDDLWEFFGNDSIRDTRPDGLLSMQSNATATVISGTGAYVLVAGTWVMENASQFTGTTGGRLIYNGTKDAKLPITFSCSLEPVSGGSTDLSMRVAINGAVVAGSNRNARTASGTPVSITLPWQAIFSTGDYVEVFVANDTNTTNVLVSSAISRVN